MSSYHSDKCSPEELKVFKDEVINWLADYGIDMNKVDIRAFRFYGGEVAIYYGEYSKFPNIKSSFRRKMPNKNDKGEIIGWTGTRGHHTTKRAEPIRIYRDEWENIKKSYNNPKNDNYDFNKDLIFDKLDKLCLK